MPRVPGLRNPGLGTKLHPRLWEECPEPWSTFMLLQWAHVLVSQLCLTLCNPMDCSPPGSSAHGISQARILEWVAIPFSKESSPPKDRAQVSCIEGRLFTIWATNKALMLGRLRAGREVGARGWDAWMAPLTQWMWVWASSGGQWRTGKPGVLQFTGLQRSDTT